MSRWVCGSLMVCLAWVLVALPAAAKEPQYVGANGCKTCHKKELIGDQHGWWLDGKHHGALETLKSDDAREIATEKGLTTPPHESGECLQCHTTSYGLEPAQIKKKPLVHEDGIQCESCHGPGSLYRKKKTMSDPDASRAAGMWEPGKDSKICTTCHNADGPTFDGFDFEEAKKEIAHPIPKDVKGKYLQIVKERKARGEPVDENDE